MTVPAPVHQINPDSLGGRIITERNRLGMTQEELAQAADVNQGTLSLIESNQTPNPKLFTALRIAGVLGVTVRYLAEGLATGPMDEYALLREILEALSPEQRQAWIAVGRAMVSPPRSPDGSAKHKGKQKPPKRPPGHSH